MNQSSQSIKKEHISINALKVISRLREHGYQAYLVGGCIRDLLLGRVPKDFDVTTDAYPEAVKDLFRNSRVVGKRFKIVHARFGREIIEITTFRAPHTDQYDETHSETGMTLVDNNYGTFTEDVFRRDFTINAIYYQPENEEIIDLADGVADVLSRTIRTIGEPESRFREDPVRMLRAARFKAKLNFEFQDSIQETIRSLGYLIQDVAPARLFEEVLKLYMSGHGVRTLEALLDNDLYGWLFPDSKRSMEQHPTEPLVRHALMSTDSRIQEDKPVTPAFIFAAMFWFPFVAEKERVHKEEGLTHVAASNEAARNILSKQQLFTSIPRRFTGIIREIWFLQFRLPTRFADKPDILMQHKRFRAAYDFLLIREAAGEKTGHLGDWWTEYQEASPERRSAMKQSVPGKRRKRGRSRKRNPNNASNGRTVGTPTPTWNS